MEVNLIQAQSKITLQLIASLGINKSLVIQVGIWTYIIDWLNDLTHRTKNMHESKKH